jgi:hypothetical protein
MSASRGRTDDDPEAGVRARITADVDAPDKIAYGLTFRQLAILAVAASAFYFVFQTLHLVVPLPVLIGAGVVLGGVAFGVAVGRRDGLPLDTWLLNAIRYIRSPKSLSATDIADATVPSWVEEPAAARRTVLPTPLRLPADAIADDGEIRLDDMTASVVAASTVNLSLRTAQEQSALVDEYGRWLNSLSGPTQIVVSAQPVDLASHATALAAATAGQPHPALKAACADHADFLADLASRRDPLRRQVLVVSRTASNDADDAAARRRANDTVRQLSGLGVTAAVLDGAGVTAAVAAAADPYRQTRPGGLAAPGTAITGPQSRSSRTERS